MRLSQDNHAPRTPVIGITIRALLRTRYAIMHEKLSATDELWHFSS